MRKSELPQIQTLNWFLEFVSIDLDKMSQRDFAKLVIDAQYYFRPKWPLAAFGIDSERWFPGDRISYYSDNLPDNWPWRDNLKKIQVYLRNFLNSNFIDLETRTAMSIAEIVEVALMFGITDDKGSVILKYSSRGKLTNLEEVKKMTEVCFAFALCGIPREAIKSCQECGKYFLHLSEKPKYYCNPKCTTRAVSRRRREKDPEGYRAYQRQIMRNKYREKKARELGKPVDKIRTQKRSASK